MGHHCIAKLLKTCTHALELFNFMLISNNSLSDAGSGLSNKEEKRGGRDHLDSPYRENVHNYSDKQSPHSKNSIIPIKDPIPVYSLDFMQRLCHWCMFYPKVVNRKRLGNTMSSRKITKTSKMKSSHSKNKLIHINDPIPV